MSTSYTSLLGLALPVTGELTGTWGAMVDNAITSPLDIAVAGTQSITGDSNVTLSVTNGDTSGTNLAQVGSGSTGSAQYAIILCSGARTALRTITAPAASKIYTIINATTGGFAVKIVGSGPTTGLTIPNGSSAVIAWNGSDFIEVGSSTVGNFTVNGNLTVTGTSTLTGAVTNTAGTANGVAYLNGSKVLTTGSALTFDGANLGIGVASPAQLIDGTAANPRLKLTATSTGYAASQFVNSSGNSYFARDNSTGSFFGIANGTIVYSSSSDPIGFFLSGSEQMRLTSTGLGIGTSSPGAKLDVSGNAVLSGVSGYKYLYLNGAIENSSLRFAKIGKNYDSTYEFGLWASTHSAGNSAATVFYRDLTTESMRLDTAGNLGLGVTPSAWSGGGLKAIEIAASGNNITANGASTYINANAYYNGGWKYGYTGNATQYLLNAGQHTWYTAPSGTAGNAITFTQAMTLDASGNLGVGTTSPQAKIHTVDVASGNPARFQGGESNYTIRILNSATTSGGSINANTGTAQGITISSDSGPTIFNNNSTERARIDSSGNLLVGTTSAFATAAYGSTQISNTYNRQLFLRNANATAGKYWGLGPDSSANALVVYNQSGTGVYLADGATSWTASSDERVKDIIEPITNAATKVASLRAVIGKYKKDVEGTRRVFLIAQDVQAVLPEAVNAQNDEIKTLGLQYTDVIPLLVAAIQEQQVIIESLKARLDAANL